MRALFDIVHPAHVHFYRHLIGELDAAGHQTMIVARDTDVTGPLLDSYGLPHVTVAGVARPTRPAFARELIRRDLALWRAIRSFGADVVLTRNPAGAHAARLARVPGVFDTDDGRAVGTLFRIAAPAATVITSPELLAEDHGRKHLKYPSYKPLAFLHPARFTPDAGVLDELGLSAGERYFVLRLVAFGSSHDRGDAGFDDPIRTRAISRLERYGRVFISSEDPLPVEWQDRELPIAPHRLHDALAFASGCVTDGQSVAGEAAVLGVPCVRYTTNAGAIAFFRELGERYDLVTDVPRGSEEELDLALDRLGADDDRAKWQARRAMLLDDHVDLTGWMLDQLLGEHLGLR